MIVTASQLKQGDVIKRFGMLYRIIVIDETHAYYTGNTHVDSNGSLRREARIGLRSQEKLELIEDVTEATKIKIEKSPWKNKQKYVRTSRTNHL